MHVYLDVDGLLADFVVGVQQALDVQFDLSKWPIDCHRVDHALGIDVNVMWSVIDNIDFWANLPIHSQHHQILETCSRFVNQDERKITLLTSLPSVVDGNRSHDPFAAAGKAIWFRQHCFEYSFALTNCKSAFAHPNAVLIDDSDSEVSKFADAGGETILVPRPWNSLHQHTVRSMEYINKKLNLLKGVNSDD